MQNNGRQCNCYNLDKDRITHLIYWQSGLHYPLLVSYYYPLLVIREITFKLSSTYTTLFLISFNLNTTKLLQIHFLGEFVQMKSSVHEFQVVLFQVTVGTFSVIAYVT
jgi:hypothetical protein